MACRLTDPGRGPADSVVCAALHGCPDATMARVDLDGADIVAALRAAQPVISAVDDAVVVANLSVLSDLDDFVVQLAGWAAEK